MDRIGRYVIVRELGRGGMGAVYLARDPTLERPVALKLLHEAEAEARARLHAEAKTLAALSHPGIVTIYEIGEHGGRDFIAMEYLRGHSLRELLSRPDLRASRDELVAMCAKVALAVDAAHQNGILHRDIKPENVVVTEAGDVKVVDFGIARRLGGVPQRPSAKRFATPIEMRAEEVVDVLTATLPVARKGDAEPTMHTMFGTPGYMAPEVLAGERSGEPADVYSLGVVLYECLAGERPFRGTLVQVIAHVIAESDSPPRLADPLAELVARMLARDPHERPSLVEVAAALAPAPSRARRWPRVAAVGGALAIAALAAWQIARSRGDAAAPSSTSRPARAATIAVEPIAVALDVYGGLNLPSRTAIGTALALVVHDITGAVAVGPAQLAHELGLPEPHPGEPASPIPAAQLADAEAKLGATVVVRGAIEQRGKLLHARLEIAAPPGAIASPRVIERDGASPAVAPLVAALAEDVARAEDPATTIAAGPRPHLARELAERGDASLAANAFYDARLYFEQAIVADPTLFEAWGGLAVARSWMQAPEADVADAVDRALALAPAGVAKRLLGGESQFLHGELAAAIATLSVLERDATLDARQRRDLYYYLGESHWHDGHHEQGVDYFQRVLELEPRFAPAAIHPAEFALARRDASNARAMIAITGTTYFKSVDFALGKYEQLAAGRDPYALYAQLVLGKPLDLSLAPRAEAAIDRASFDLARAVDAGDEPAARRAIAAVWRYLEAPDHGPVLPQEYYSLAAFGELVIAAGRADDARRLVGFFAIRARDRPSGYPRLQLAAAPLVGERAWVVLDHLTDREAKLAAAAGAELAGDRAHAAELYGELVDDPTPTWDYVERAALLRVLRALGRTKDAAALCADTLKPAMFRYAWFALKRACTPH